MAAKVYITTKLQADELQKAKLTQRLSAPLASIVEYIVLSFALADQDKPRLRKAVQDSVNQFIEQDLEKHPDTAVHKRPISDAAFRKQTQYLKEAGILSVQEKVLVEKAFSTVYTIKPLEEIVRLPFLETGKEAREKAQNALSGELITYDDKEMIRLRNFSPNLVPKHDWLFFGVLDSCCRTSPRDPRDVLTTTIERKDGDVIGVLTVTTSDIADEITHLGDLVLKRRLLNACRQGLLDSYHRIKKDTGSSPESDRDFVNQFNFDAKETFELIPYDKDSGDWDQSVERAFRRLRYTIHKIDVSKAPELKARLGLPADTKQHDVEFLTSFTKGGEPASSAEKRKAETQMALGLNDTRPGNPFWIRTSLNDDLFKMLCWDVIITEGKLDEVKSLFLSHEQMFYIEEDLIQLLYNKLRAVLTSRKDNFENKWHSREEVMLLLGYQARPESFTERFLKHLDKQPDVDGSERQLIDVVKEDKETGEKRIVKETKFAKIKIPGYWVEYQRMQNAKGRAYKYRFYRDVTDKLTGDNSRHATLNRKEQIDLTTDPYSRDNY